MRRRVLAALRTAIGVPLFFIFTLGLASYLIVVAFVRPHHPYLDRVIRFWARRFMGVAPIELEVVGLDRVDTNRQYVYVANHLSNFDIPVLFAALPSRIRFLSKKEVYKIPIVATAMRRVGIVKIDRAAGAGGHAQINKEIGEAKSHGYSLIIFPEGTRSRDSDFHGFKKGAFRIGIANEMDIVPVTIHGTWEVWPPDAKMFFPGKASVVIHDPIPVAGLRTRDIGEIRDRAHAVIEETWNELKASTA